MNNNTQKTISYQLNLVADFNFCFKTKNEQQSTKAEQTT